MAVRTFALTYPQLMSQAIADGMDEQALQRLRGGYEVAERMTDGLYRAQGAPFLSHLVRSASIVLAERRPVKVVIATLLHAAYLLHCFEGSQRRNNRPQHRVELRQKIGPEAEQLIWEYERLPWFSTEALARHLREVASCPPATRDALIMRLANELEDHLDLGMAFGGGAPYQQKIETSGARRVELARRLGLAQLAEELREVYDAHLSCRLPQAVIRGRRLAYELPRRRWWQMGVGERLQVRGRQLLRPYLAEAKRRLVRDGSVQSTQRKDRDEPAHTA